MKAGKHLAVLTLGMALASGIAAPALAQQAKASAQGSAQIIVTETNLPDAYTALGAVTANVHPKSMNPKTPTHDLLDAELRRQAAKLGADAVIQVRYTLRNPMMSDKGSDAAGVAVKFTGPAPTPVSAPVAVPPPQLATASSPPPLPRAPLPPVQNAAPQGAAQAAPAPPAAPSAPPPSVTPAPVAPPPQFASAAAPAAPAPARAVRHATSIDMIVLSEQDFAGRRYARVGDVRSEVHQKSMFPKTPSKDLLNANIKAQALKLGADAVVQVKYDMHNALTSTKGDIVTGVAVRFE
jgi:uncharacterized protein YbjQ (UPF0145 family)